jgi:hypothetical protein
MPYTATGNYVSPWMLRSQENLRNPNPLSLNKPVIKKTNNNGRVAFSPMKVSPKLRKTRKNRKSRKTGTRRR